MTPTLRKWHQVVWPISIVLMIVLFIAALTARPDSYRSNMEEATNPVEKYALLKEVQVGNVVVRLRAGNWLELALLSPLNVASALVYIGSERKVLLGRLAEKQIYHFPLPADIETNQFSVYLYDGIKNEEIAMFDFEDLSED